MRFDMKLGFVVVPLLAGCADAGPAGEDLALADDDIIGGEETSQHPAIGWIGNHNCSATLISSRVVISAAHCFQLDDGKFDTTRSGLATNGGSPSWGEDSGLFYLKTASGAEIFRRIRRVKVFGIEVGESDIAVAELDDDIPAYDATPLVVAERSPEIGEWVDAYGYGCTKARWDEDYKAGYPDGGGGVKRRMSFEWVGYGAHESKDQNGCYGDSGGPVLDAWGEIAGITSSGKWKHDGGSHYIGGTRFANPVAKRKSIGRMNAIYGNGVVCNVCDGAKIHTWDDHYLVAEYGGGDVVNANRTAAGGWETFRLVPLGGSYYGIQAPNGQFVGAENGGGGAVYARANLLRDWEVFRLDPQGETAIQTIDGHYLSAVDGGGSTLNAEVTWVDTWETFFVSAGLASIFEL